MCKAARDSHSDSQVHPQNTVVGIAGGDEVDLHSLHRKRLLLVYMTLNLKRSKSSRAEIVQNRRAEALATALALKKSMPDRSDSYYRERRELLRLQAQRLLRKSGVKA